MKYNQRDLDAIFSSLTRKHVHKLASKSVGESSNVQWEIPKNRYLSKIRLMVEGTFTVTHATETTWTSKAFAPQRFVNNINLNINNGFSPFKTTGIGAYLMNLVNPRNTGYSTQATSATSRANNILTGVASSGGTSNTLKFTLELPLCINNRDYMGIINAGDPTTNIILEIDSGTILDLFATTTGFSISSIAITATPVVETLSIPDNPLTPKNPRTHLLDLSLIKLVHSQSKTISASGEEIINLPRGTTYRKLIVYAHASNTGLTDAEISRFQIALNQADTIFDATGKQLGSINEIELGDALPAGVWVFDFTYQGNPNYGGTRDYIDSESLNEFWMKLQFETSASLNYYYETIAKMK